MSIFLMVYDGFAIGDIGDHAKLVCIVCGAEYPPDPYLFKCRRCGGLLEVRYRELKWAPSGRGVWRYSSMLPRTVTKLSMGEGQTPLVRSKIGEGLYIKFDGANPTGSFKDRGMAVAMSVAVDAGAKAVIVASTGNTAASVSAYAARAGIKPIVLLPKGGVAKGKLFQSALHGALIVEVDGNFDRAMKMVMDMAGKVLYPMNSFNPWRLEGQKTTAFEIFEELGCPDNVIVPVGNAGNTKLESFVIYITHGYCTFN